MQRLISWNVNGIRAIYRKKKYEWLQETGADAICLQETKAHPEQLTGPQKNLPGYQAFFHSAERKGYSGVVTFSKREPERVIEGLGIEEFDSEGRSLALDYGDYILYNVYFPNGKSSDERLDYKMRFYGKFLKQMKALLDEGRKVVICGDVNTAHKEKDLARPKENSDTSGFLPMERKWIDQLLEAGFVDVLREYTQEGELYTWWDYKTRARKRNVGWRIDYFFTSKNLKDHLRDFIIHNEVMGSDHCPIELDLEI